MKQKISIIGVGMVGGALQRYFENQSEKFDLIIYDKGKKIGSLEEAALADYIYICVPTPSTNDFNCDTSIVEEVINQIDFEIHKQEQKQEKVVIIKSTVIPGTTKQIQEKHPDLAILFNPEFLTELTADQDMNYPDRQIIGYTQKSYSRTGEVMQQLPLAPFEKIIPAAEAETVKYFGNTWFAVKVIFANQIYDLCQKLGINYDLVKEGVAADKRIGRSHLEIFHKGYRGYGDMNVSKCLPKDIKALIQLGDKKEVDLKLLKVVDSINTELWQIHSQERDR